ncbi:MAG: NYN domain-containing protein [Candidatus Acidiferrum sp.]|jgi:uncharacterized LabA/DUF88 family protein
MLFVDGENLTIRGQEFASKNKLALTDGTYWRKDCFLWMPNPRPLQRPHCMSGEADALESEALRAYYYTSLVGSHDDLENTEISLRGIGFAPKVFKKPSGDRKSKGVDIALTADMLTHAFQSHFDVAILLGGDAYYCPLVNRVKSLGKQVWVWFFASKEDGLGRALWKSSDVFIPLDSLFTMNWPALDIKAASRR